MDVTDDIMHKKTLTEQLKWFYSFTWSVFKNAENIHYPHAEVTCDMLSWSGLLYAGKGYLDVTTDCINNIYAVSSSYFEKTTNPNAFNIADLLIGLWHIRFYAERMNLRTLVIKVDDKFDEFSKLSGDAWVHIAESIENRKEHLERHLEERWDDFRNMERSEDMLKDLLKPCWNTPFFKADMNYYYDAMKRYAQGVK